MAPISYVKHIICQKDNPFRFIGFIAYTCDMARYDMPFQPNSLINQLTCQNFGKGLLKCGLPHKNPVKSQILIIRYSALKKPFLFKR